MSTQNCAARSHALPRFDVEFLEGYLDEYKELKREIYGKLESRQDLLVATVEGLTKGQETSAFIGSIKLICSPAD